MGLTVVTQPTEWPLTLVEAKAHLRVRHAEEDTYILDLVKAATVYLEGQFDVTLTRRQYSLTLDAFSDTIELPKKPVASVDAVRYYDVAGVNQLLSPAVYTADLSSTTPWVVRNSALVWPTIMSGINMVSVVFTAGYLPAAVPHDAKQGIRLLIGHWYAQRETVVIGSIASKVPFGVQAIIESMMVPVG